MKKYILFLMLLTLFGSKVLKAQEYQEPQWQMPLYFEDAEGQKDTIWWGYDPDASLYQEIDPQFNEDWMRIDSSKFNAFIDFKWDYTSKQIYLDTVRKRDISSWPLMISSYVAFTHGKLPVTMKWEEELLNSPNLPAFYPDISPRPKARIDLIFNEQPFYSVDCFMIIDGIPDIILTGYITSFPTCFCAISDSLVFNPNPPYTVEMSDLVYYQYPVLLGIAPHNFDYWASIGENEDIDFLVYPNPVNDKFTIYTNYTTGSILEIYNNIGQKVYQTSITNQVQEIHVSDLESGIYLVKIVNNLEVLKTEKLVVE